MYFTIYKITNLINNQIYIGMHRTLDLNDDYFGSGKLILRAIKKYGIENFKKEILFVFDNEIEMIEKEKELLTEQFVLNRDNYNLNTGGVGSWHHANTKMSKQFRQEIARKSHEVQKEKQTGLWSDKCRYEGFKNLEHRLKAQKTLSSNKSKQKIAETRKRINFQQGKNNSQFGTCYIFNDELLDSKRIKLIELEIYLIQGWKRGRKLKYEQLRLSKKL